MITIQNIKLCEITPMLVYRQVGDGTVLLLLNKYI